MEGNSNVKSLLHLQFVTQELFSKAKKCATSHSLVSTCGKKRRKPARTGFSPLFNLTASVMPLRAGPVLVSASLAPLQPQAATEARGQADISNGRNVLVVCQVVCLPVDSKP